MTVPNAWNAGDNSDASFAGGVGWYRKDFRFPSNSRSRSWVVRFESVNYRSKAWLNGRPIGTNRGAYLPFEFRLPAAASSAAAGVNHLVIRVDSKPPADRLPARRAVDDRRADRRLVELRRPAARGLPAADQRHRLQHGRRPAEPRRARRARRRSATASRCATTATRRGGCTVRGAVRQPRRSTSARKAVGAEALRDVHAQRPDRAAAPVVARPPDALQRPAHASAPAGARCSATRCAPASARSRSSAGACSSTAGR